MLLTRTWDAVPALIVVTLKLMTFALDSIQDVTFRLFEHPQNKQLVGNIFQAARLPDHVRSVRLDAVESNWLSLFHLDRPTGNLYTSDQAVTALDRETICPASARDQINRVIEQQCVISLLASVNNRVLIKINIILEDLNDNPPTFPNSSTPSGISVQTLRVEETNSYNSIRLNLQLASDLDEGGAEKIYYYLNPTDSPFRLVHKRRSKSEHGLEELYLVPREPLDFEKVPEYWMNLTACDAQVSTDRVRLSVKSPNYPVHCSTQPIHVLVVNVDDEKPVFEHKNYSAILKETAPVGYELVTVKATDSDAPPFNRVVYQLLPSNTVQKELFNIDPAQGIIRLAKPIPGPGVYRFYVLATSESIVNNFTTVADYLRENVNHVDKEVNIARIILHVIDTNNHAPTVSLQTSKDTSHHLINMSEFADAEAGVWIKLSENTAVPHILAYFRVVDPDSAGNAKTNCTLLPSTQISPKLSSLMIHDNMTHSLRFVQVSQLTEHVTIYRLVLNESIDAEQLIKKRPIDPSSIWNRPNQASRICGIAPIKIHCEDHGDPILIGSLIIYLVILDEDEYLPQLQVTLPTGKRLQPFVLQDGRNPVLAYNRTLKEDCPVGTTIARLSVLDRDVVSQPVFSIGGAAFPVEVNQTTGYIYSVKPFDFETNRWYRIDLTVKEYHNWSSATLKLNAVLNIELEDVNDNAPVFTYPPLMNQTRQENPSYWRDYHVDGLRLVHVAEELPEGTRFAQIKAVDADSGLNAEIRYFLVDILITPADNWTKHRIGSHEHETARRAVTQSSNFMINNEGYIWSKSRLDREQIAHIDLLVGAQDFGTPAMTSYTSVRIVLTDINDHEPRWQFPTEQDYLIVIPQDKEVGSTVTRIRAIDPDDKRHNGRVSYSILLPNESVHTDETDLTVQCRLANALFTVDENNGELILRHPMQTLPTGFLDIWLMVTDHGEAKQRYSLAKLVAYVASPREEVHTESLALQYRNKSHLIVNQFRSRKSLEQILSLLTVHSSAVKPSFSWHKQKRHLSILISCIVIGLFLISIIIVSVILWTSKRRRTARKSNSKVARQLRSSSLQSLNNQTSFRFDREIQPNEFKLDRCRIPTRVSLKNDTSVNRIDSKNAFIKASEIGLMEGSKYNTVPSTSHVFQCRQEALLQPHSANNQSLALATSVSTPTSISILGSGSVRTNGSSDSDTNAAYIPVNSLINFPSTIPLKIVTLSASSYPMAACLSESDSNQSYLNFPNIITSIVPVCHVQPDFIPVCSPPSAALSTPCDSYMLDPGSILDQTAVISTGAPFMLTTATDPTKLYKDKFNTCEREDPVTNTHILGNNHSNVNCNMATPRLGSVYTVQSDASVHEVPSAKQ